MKRTVGLSFGGAYLTITGDYDKGQPACYYQRNGDPGWPEDPGYFEITRVMLGGIDLTDFVLDNFMPMAIDLLCDRCQDECWNIDHDYQEEP